MPALLIYLLKVNIALLLFCLGYYTVLRRLTFYTLNRGYLLFAIVFCSLYPIIDFSGVVQQHQKLVQPLQVIIINLNTSAGQLPAIVKTDYWQWVVLIFWIGVGLMSIRLLIQFVSLFKLYRRSEPGVLHQSKVRLINNSTNPFSFWQTVYINPQLHTDTEIASIIAHEQIHVKQWHTLDIILAELSLIFYWFNPGVWLIKKAISENLEFITDRSVLQQGIDSQSYQYNLLKVSCAVSENTVLVNHFNLSTLKRRIIMMNSKKSAVYNLSRYSFIIPATLVLLLAFGTSKAALIKNSVNAAAKTVTQHAIALANMASAVVNPGTNTDTGKKQLVAANSKKQENAALATENTDTVKRQTDTRKLYVKLNKAALSDSTYYLIDGVHATVNQFKSLSPSDIARIDIVPLGSISVKLFGDEASKGAIVTTTKGNPNTELTTRIKDKIDSYHKWAVNPIDGYIKIIQSDSTSSIKGKWTENGDSDYAVTGIYIGTYSGNGIVSASNSPTQIEIVQKPGNFKPLYVIDGTPNYGFMPPTLSPNDVKQISILKDSVGTSLYGEAGRHGVILITTKYAKNIKK